MPETVSPDTLGELETHLPRTLYHADLLIAVSDATASEMEDRLGVGRRIVHTVHEELLALAPTEHAQEVLDKMIWRMCQNPAWTDNQLVLAAEGGFDSVYSK